MDDPHPVQAMAELQLVEGRADLAEDMAVPSPRTLDQLPDEIIQHILSFLPVCDLLVAADAFIPSRRWQEAVDVALSRCHELDPALFQRTFSSKDEWLLFSSHSSLSAQHSARVVLKLLPSKMPQLRSIWRQKRGRSDFSDQDVRIKTEVLYKCCHSLVDIDFTCVSFGDASVICQHYPALQRVRMPTLYSARQLTLLLQNQPKLRTLEITSNRETGMAFLFLPPSLEKLVVIRCKHLDTRNLRGVAKCPRLRELELCELRSLRAHELAEVIAGCPQLEHLSLTRSQAVKLDHMRELTRCASLRVLDVSRCPDVKEQDIAAVVAACPQLERLTIKQMNGLKPERCLPSSGAAGIRYLDISRNDGATDDTLRQLPALVPRLQTLVMPGCRQTKGNSLGSLLLFPELESLDIRLMCGVTDFTLKSLEGCQVRELRFKPNSRRCSAKGITSFVLSCPSLTSLKLELGWSCEITRHDMKSLVQQVLSKPDFTMAIPQEVMEDVEELSADLQRLELLGYPDCYVEPTNPYSSSDSEEWDAMMRNA